MNNDIQPHDGHADEEHSPMEIDCKEVNHNEHNQEVKKEPFSADNEHFPDSRSIFWRNLWKKNCIGQF